MQLGDAASATGPTRDDAARRGDMQLALSNAIVRLYKEHYGKGPTRARAYIQGDVITCVLRDCFTRAEHTLIASGHDQAVIEGRYRLQTALRRRFVETVEEITGRRVIGFMSGTQLDPDMTAEVFVLEPETPGSGNGGNAA